MSTCRDVREIAPDLALGDLAGPERAAAIAHLAGCIDCRRYVDELAGAADALLVLAPEAEPPAGFESRVIASLRAKRGGSKRWIAAVAAAAVAAAGLAWLGAMRVYRVDRETRAAFEQLGGRGLRAAAFHTPAAPAQQLGRVVAYDGEPSWVFLWVRGGQDTEPGAYRIAFDYTDAATRVLPRTMSMSDSGGSWAGIVEGSVASLRSVRLIGADGAHEYVALFSR